MYDSAPNRPHSQDPRPHALVIGAGMGGLAGAMRLGAKGYRVTVIDPLDSVGGRGSALHRDGHRFDLGPTIVTVPRVFRELWSACGRDFDQDVDLRAMEPYYEIRWPDGERFVMSGNEDVTRAEIERLSPWDLPNYERFLKAAEARYVVGFEGLFAKPMHRLWDTIKVLPTFAKLRADQSIYRLAARYFRDERLRMAFSFHPLFIGGDPTRVTSMYALVSHLEKAFGVHYAIGGVAAMANAMARVVEDQGGAIRLGEEADEILVREDRAVGVRLVTGEVIAADVVVSNADAGHTYDRLLKNRAKRRWTPAKLRRSRWSMGLFVWYFGTKGTRQMWQDVGHHTILSGPRYTALAADIFRNGVLAEDMSLYLHRPSVTDPTCAPEGDDTFYALSPVPHLGHRAADWAEIAEDYRLRVQAVLEDQCLPGLGERLGPQEVFTPETFKTRYLSPHGAGFSLEPRILQSAWFRPHNISEEVDGLFLVGAGTHPGAGLPGVVGSADVMAKLVPDADLMVPADVTPQERIAAE